MVNKQKEKNKIIGWEFPTHTHPGEHLFDFLEEYNISQTELSKRTGISKKAINEIIRGKGPITQNTAFRLSKVFPVSPDFWINLQNNYNIALARIEEDEKIVQESKNFLQEYKETYRELTNHGFLESLRWSRSNYTNIVKQLQNFFAVDSLAYIKKRTMGFAFRTHKKSLNQYSLAAWVQLGKIKAQNTVVAPFNREKLKEKLIEIKSLSLKKPTEYLPKLEKELADCGVVLVYATHFKKVPAQGAVKWVSADKVLLMLNTTNQYEDRFWFNLFHELGHILLHGKKDPYIEIENGGNTEEEEEANNFAKKQLIPYLSEFYDYLSKSESMEKAIEGFADKNGISSAIVAGRLTHEHREKTKDVYKVMSPFLDKRINYTNLEIAKNKN